jgi:hypothetical protein
MGLKYYTQLAYARGIVHILHDLLVVRTCCASYSLVRSLVLCILSLEVYKIEDLGGLLWEEQPMVECST